MTIYCKQCNNKITSKYAKIFCSRSCSVSFTNKGVRRHGQAPNDCLVCGEKTASIKKKYCSVSCYKEDIKAEPKPPKKPRILVSEEHKRKLNAAGQSRYRAKQYRVLAPTANKDAIKKIYLNCPEGYEVDHKIPLSKGGLHHEDNLQYLTIAENRSKGSRLDWK